MAWENRIYGIFMLATWLVAGCDAPAPAGANVDAAATSDSADGAAAPDDASTSGDVGQRTQQDTAARRSPDAAPLDSSDADAAGPDVGEAQVDAIAEETIDADQVDALDAADDETADSAALDASPSDAADADAGDLADSDAGPADSDAVDANPSDAGDAQDAASPSCPSNLAGEAAVLDAMFAAFNAHDPWGLVKTVTEDAVWLVPSSPAVFGKSALKAYYTAQFQKWQTTISYTIDETVEAGDWGFVRGTAIEASTSQPGLKPWAAKYLGVLRRKVPGCTWKIARMSWNHDQAEDCPSGP